jgi:tetratricopeptide (TPR) repeat protein
MGPIVIVIVLVVAGAFGLIKMSGDDPAPPETGGNTTTGPDTPELKNVEVPDYVWEKLEFLDGEGNLDAALDFAEENEKLTPNAKLRQMITKYRRELGIDVVTLTPAQLQRRAVASMGKGNYGEALEDLDEAIEGDPDNATLYFLRGKCKGLEEDRLGALGDLKSALNLGYQPASDAEALLERFE